MRNARRVVLVSAIGAAVAAIASTGHAASGSPANVEKVNFRLNWVVAGNHAPFYLAQQKGLWSRCGLDVTMTPGTGSGATAQLVANGSQEFGLTDAVSITAARAHGLPVKSIGALYQTNPSSIVSKKSAGIVKLQDVAGKTWGAVPSGSPYLLLKALFKKYNITTVKEADVPSPGIAQLKTGQVDFITFFGNEAANVDPDYKKDLNIVWFKDYGQDIYGLAIATGDDYLKSHPQQVACFRQGVIEGFKEAQANPEAALQALYAGAPLTKSKPEVQAALLQGALDFTGTDLLAQSTAKWQATQELLFEAGITPKKVDPSSLFWQPR
ncbi:MAG TPA: ABC transporter substrate-binding protein [Caldimonas sp.]|nr:ABC transporter substrate-binding protein [Caldimonas sp.]